MRKHLYFICPTDCLEMEIKNAFGGEPYFHSSIGNSIDFYATNGAEFSAFIESKGINRVIFVLADDNQFLMDAVTEESSKYLKDLDCFYNTITKCKSESDILWKSESRTLPIITQYLENKVGALSANLDGWLLDQIHIDFKIFSSKEHTFKEINYDLFSRKHFSLS